MASGKPDDRYTSIAHSTHSRAALVNLQYCQYLLQPWLLRLGLSTLGLSLHRRRRWHWLCQVQLIPEGMQVGGEVGGGKEEVIVKRRWP